MAKDLGELVTTDELCTLFKVHRRTIYRWIESGKLKAIKVGKRLYFEPADVEALKQTVN